MNGNTVQRIAVEAFSAFYFRYILAMPYCVSFSQTQSVKLAGSSGEEAYIEARHNCLSSIVVFSVFRDLCVHVVADHL